MGIKSYNSAILKRLRGLVEVGHLRKKATAAETGKSGPQKAQNSKR